ncbi:hypothetical protein [Pseudomonas sp. NPDC087804]|uniref:hypothetical protein n=1 Tax=Pseudomonas sp. NPDC087804 TaxID=3364449 RepID=UPI0038162872
MPTENKSAKPQPKFAIDAEPKPYPDRLCRLDYAAHPYRCGCLSGDEEAQRRFDEHQRGTKLATTESEVTRLTAERDALQQRLNAADQLISEQRVSLTRIHDRAHAFAEDECIMRVASVEVIRDIAARALGMDGKPPTYKPGLYAVRHIDNWDGERDVALTFAMLDADGKWTEKETGEPLLAYKGDKVLRAWPLDCSHAPDTQIIGVPRDWLQDWALELVEAAQDGGQMSNQVEHLLEIHSKP